MRSISRVYHRSALALSTVSVIMLLSASIKAEIPTGMSRFWNNLQSGQMQKLRIIGTSRAQGPGYNYQEMWWTQMLNDTLSRLFPGKYTQVGQGVVGNQFEQVLAELDGALNDATINAYIVEVFPLCTQCSQNYTDTNGATINGQAELVYFRDTLDSHVKNWKDTHSDKDLFLWNAYPGCDWPGHQTGSQFLQARKKAIIDSIASKYGAYVINTWNQFAAICGVSNPCGCDSIWPYMRDAQHASKKADGLIIVPTMVKTFSGTGEKPGLSRVTIDPMSAWLKPGATQQFNALGVNSWMQAVSPQPAFLWSVAGGGTISGTGLFTAGSTEGGPFSIIAKTTDGTNLACTTSVTISNTDNGTLIPAGQIKQALVLLDGSGSWHLPSASASVIEGKYTGASAAIPVIDAVVTAGVSTLHWNLVSDADGLWFDDGANNFVAYAFLPVLNQTARQIKLMLRHDDGVTVWMNGVQVASIPGYDNGVEGASQAFTLPAGENKFLFKLEDTGGGHVLGIRFTDVNGTSLADLRTRLTSTTQATDAYNGTITTPQSGALVHVNDSLLVTFTPGGNAGLKLDFRISSNQGLTWTTMRSASIAANAGSFKWKIPATFGGQSALSDTVYIRANAYGSDVSVWSAPFKIVAPVGIASRKTVSIAGLMNRVAIGKDMLLLANQDGAIVELRLLNLSGKVLMSKSLTGGSNLSVPLSALNCGVVVISLKNRENKWIQSRMIVGR